MSRARRSWMAGLRRLTDGVRGLTRSPGDGTPILTRVTPAEFTGRIMGTYYVLTLTRMRRSCSAERAHQAASDALRRVETLMSIYRTDSEVASINRADHRDWIPVDGDTAAVIRMACDISRASGGAYDITVAPLVNLWGFGPGGIASRPPDSTELATLRGQVGMDRLEVRLNPPAVRKRDPRVTVDLGGIAKGFAVDRAGMALEDLGVSAYCLEVGGEIRVRGRNPHGRAWQVAIETPDAFRQQQSHRIVSLTHGCVASSGDYRQCFEHEGRRYGHVLDPRTGSPTAGEVSSVTVLDESCARADGWATALMVLGGAAGMAVAGRERLPACFLLRSPEGIVERCTPAFQALPQSARDGRRRPADG